MSKHNSEIKFTVELDENKIPEKLSWDAKDGGIDNEPTKAVLISVWDDKKKETLKMDLWTKDMPLDEMQHFFHQTLLSMSDTFYRATNDEKMTATMRDFCDYFAEKLELLEK
ncbi:gliding motility protein GldC [Aureibaculum algae]|uniref:Gliding motility protein GldC n=2 Tax=Aureibaculum TaxID=2706948 RepID=A0A5B7TS91_9FLAO|nr:MULTISPECIES: gliding motility protein GldC [Aureibaculum]MBJ2173770.1 gliding motility protein GldC [Aureibaculum flavum]QCX37492.1 gliding motility protein GldC [Aureibaculum algae]